MNAGNVSKPPFRQKPVEKLEEYRSKYNSSWIKLHPVHQLFKPNAYREEEGKLEALEEIYDYAQSNGFPITFHTGTSIFPGARIKYGDPIFLDDVAVDFPRLKIVMAHGGRPFWMEEAFFLLRRHKNIYLDIAGIPPKKLLEYFPRFREIYDRSLFGSDWISPGIKSIKDNVDQFMSLQIEDNIKEMVLYKNYFKIVKF
ncbi:amidohydrolase family protein [Acidianus sp. DSM 29099]|nr:amidohydrolase family protein [Acidianus sp. RZ1]